MSELMLPLTRPNLHKACNESCFRQVDQDDMYVLQSKSMSDLMSSSLTGIKTAESLFGEKSKFFCVFSSKSDVALHPYWH